MRTLSPPRHRLPRTASPMLDETVDSYLRRLAHLNGIDEIAFRTHLTDEGNPAHPSRSRGWPS